MEHHGFILKYLIKYKLNNLDKLLIHISDTEKNSQLILLKFFEFVYKDKNKYIYSFEKQVYEHIII